MIKFENVKTIIQDDSNLQFGTHDLLVHVACVCSSMPWSLFDYFIGRNFVIFSSTNKVVKDAVVVLKLVLPVAMELESD